MQDLTKKLLQLGYKKDYLKTLLDPQFVGIRFSHEDIETMENFVSNHIRIETTYANCVVKRTVFVKRVCPSVVAAAVEIEGGMITCITPKSIASYNECGIVRISRPTFDFHPKTNQLTVAGMHKVSL